MDNLGSLTVATMKVPGLRVADDDGFYSAPTALVPQNCIEYDPLGGRGVVMPGVPEPRERMSDASSGWMRFTNLMSSRWANGGIGAPEYFTIFTAANFLPAAYPAVSSGSSSSSGADPPSLDPFVFQARWGTFLSILV